MWPMSNDPSLVFSGSHASTKDWSLPDDLAMELSDIKHESVEHILDRYGMQEKPVAVHDAKNAQKAPESAFMTALLREANSKADSRTANNAPAYSTTSNSLVDLFWKLNPTADTLTLNPLLEAAWAMDPLSTLKIIWQARSIHEGKGIKDHVFYHLIGFLYQHHPRTLIINLHLLVEKECTRSDLAVNFAGGIEELIERESMSHGYYKDLLDILVLALSNTLIRDVTPQATIAAFHPSGSSAAFGRLFVRAREVAREDNDPPLAKHKTKRWLKMSVSDRALLRGLAKRGEHASFRQHLIVKLQQETKFRALYVVICKLFAEALLRDLEVVTELDRASSEEKYAISSKLTLAAKWAPTPAKAHDGRLLVATAIATILFPDISDTIDRRVTYQKKILTHLRKVLDIPEAKMTAGNWNQINYGRCASKCMARNKVNFFLHDEERFFKYLENVAEGKKKLSCATLLPHELVIEACRTQADWKMAARLPGDKLARMLDVDGRVVDAQWKTLLASIRDASRSGEGLTNSIAVVDVSGSMGQLGASRDKNNPYPIDVAIALGLLTAQLAEEPFNGAFITFSAEPQIVRLPKGQSLRQLVKGMSHANWGMNTDIVKVFQLLLDIAVNNDLKKEQMIKRIFIFSDMQFDQASQNYGRNEVVHQAMKKKFREAGYYLPEIVFWNIAGETTPTGTLPARADQPGVQLLSGYSASIMKTFLRGDLDNALKKSGPREEAVKSEAGEAKLASRPERKEAHDKSNPFTLATARAKLAQILDDPVFSKLRVVD